MNLGLVFALITIPAVAWADLDGKEYTVFSCTVTKYSGVFYQHDNILGKGRGYPVTSFDACVEKCLIELGCVAVNVVGGKTCQLLKTGIDKPDRFTYKTDYLTNTNSDHAFINCPEPKTADSSVGCGTPADAYKQNLFKATTRIIGGSQAVPHSWPWQVFFQWAQGTSNGLTTRNCGATLIRVRDDKEESDMLVTAAHCITDKDRKGNPVYHDTKLLRAFAGDHDRNAYEEGEQGREVESVLMHPQYTTTGTRNDIALVKLVKPFKFSDTIRPACLPKQDEELPVGKKCAATGWGRIDSKKGGTSPTLKQVIADVQKADTCIRNVNGGWGRTYVEKEMICAGSLQAKESTCQGDSGGGLVCENEGKWTLYGAVSFGRDTTCLTPGAPSVFARVSNYVDWITKNAAKMTSV